MNILAIKIIVAELNHSHAIENPENIFEISFDKSGDLIVDWQNRKVRALVKNLAKELGLNYKKDFKIGHTRVEDLPLNISTHAKLKKYLAEMLEEYIAIAEIFIK